MGSNKTTVELHNLYADSGMASLFLKAAPHGQPQFLEEEQKVKKGKET